MSFESVLSHVDFNLYPWFGLAFSSLLLPPWIETPDGPYKNELLDTWKSYRRKSPKNDHIHTPLYHALTPTSPSSFSCFSCRPINGSNPEVRRDCKRQQDQFFQAMGMYTIHGSGDLVPLTWISTSSFYFKLSFITVFHHFKLNTLLLTRLIHLFVLFE